VKNLTTRFLLSVCLILLIGGLAACNAWARPSPPPEETDALFIPPTLETHTPSPFPGGEGAPEKTAVIFNPTPTTTCYNDLRFLQDLSFLDGAIVKPGAEVDKRWQVQNSGSCNWHEGYTLQQISGDALGVDSPQTLYPARSNTNAIIQLIFTAPTAPGEYFSTWQAVDLRGNPFGEAIYLHIVVEDTGN
jgi:hypothetical protein